MGEVVALLKVYILRGNRLVVRDFTSSDPYVVVKLGNQTAKTKVINSCLNPVWNEELSFSVTDPLEILKLEVFDRDRFKSDDKMGHTHLDLHPIASVSRLRRVLPVTGNCGEETKLRKVIPGPENCLVSESYVSCVNGEIVQDVRLRLDGVESGELEVKVKWVDVSSSASAAAAGH
ncbi:putative ADP-ribosylation factor GTPase-activating protein AGD11 [Acorus gramineus]|uniref:ADP-ribosylation factor GTPase-activating protein AGD11 n=1 Tax=Acorus gramineus TaxID=55184 RepID=A0AAV9AXG9_ACOGR|nr:putative ADP-ribosylation factor GTPase-activating protein AGD11 [Acorus gramineus]